MLDDTDLKSRNDVALDCVTLTFGHTSHVEVTLEGGERHSAANDGRIISHYLLIRHELPYAYRIITYLPELTLTQSTR